MEMVYYKEEELYNGSEGVFAEDYKFVWVGDDYKIGLCINAQTLFCRADKCSDGHEYLSQTNRASSWLKMLDTICPKMAWGITAWLLFYTNRDDKGRLRFLDTTKAEVFAKYKEECLSRYRYFQKDEYDYLRENGDTDGITKLDEAFTDTHIQQEREYISRFAHHECMTEEYYKAIAQCAKEYIKWVEDSEEKASANVERTNVHRGELYIEKPLLDYGRLLEYLKKWNDSEHNKRHTQIISRSITTEEFRKEIRNAEMCVIEKPTYREYIIKALEQYFPNEWMADIERKIGKKREDINSNGSRLSEHFRNPFNIKRYEIK